MPQKLIAITGGIGSGKSVVSRVLRAMGHPVYDCDSEARRLMEGSEEIKAAIRDNITPDGVRADGSLDRAAIAAVVFNDPEKLAVLDAAAHAAVIADIQAWRGHQGRRSPLFVETAILYKSGLDRVVDEIWEVTAPEELRVRRACARDHCDESAVRARIASQSRESEAATGHRLIINDGTRPVLPRILELLAHGDTGEGE